MMFWIIALYVSSMAQVKVNGGLSPVFPIGNGTRQGCPLSCLLFALVLEPLPWKIRAIPNIRGIPVGYSEHKLSAYADNVLYHFYSTETCISAKILSPECVKAVHYAYTMRVFALLDTQKCVFLHSLTP